MISFTDPVKSTSIVSPDLNLSNLSRTPLDQLTDAVSREVLEIPTPEMEPLLDQRKAEIVTSIADGLRELYIDEKMGHTMAEVITQNFQRGDYQASTSLLTFRQAILQDLRAICPDKHLDLMYHPHPISKIDPDRSLKELKPEELTAEQKEYLESYNVDRPDFSKAVESRLIDTEIGYFKINNFPPLEFPETKVVIDKAMGDIKEAGSLIIDLRENTGGEPATVAFVASYFFDQRQLINQVYQRSTNELTSFYSEPKEQGFGGKKPIYVLTSERTFSGGEELAYDLQSAKRATVVGQVTAGGAHPIRTFVVDDHLYLGIPKAKAINPDTHKNWEGTGVIPDREIAKEEDALAVVLTKK